MPNSPLAHYVIRVSVLFHIAYKGNPKACFEETLEVLLWDLKDIVPSPIKVTTRNHSHIIRSSRSEVVVTRSTTADDLNLQGWSWSYKLESLCCETFEWDLKVTSKAACVGVNPRREGVHGFGACTWLC